MERSPHTSRRRDRSNRSVVDRRTQEQGTVAVCSPPSPQRSVSWPSSPLYFSPTAITLWFTSLHLASLYLLGVDPCSALEVEHLIANRMRRPVLTSVLLFLPTVSSFFKYRLTILNTKTLCRNTGAAQALTAHSSLISASRIARSTGRKERVLVEVMPEQWLQAQTNGEAAIH